MRFFIIIATVTAMFAGAPQQRPPRPGENSKSISLTGCVDQRGEQFVLTGTESMKVETVLRGRAFADENFARYVGRKATVQGELRVESDQRTLYVVRIEKVSDTCH